MASRLSNLVTSTNTGTHMDGLGKQTGKKLTIKPLRARPKLPQHFQEQTWTKVEEAIHAIHKKQPVSSSLEELYRAVEDLCVLKYSNQVYERLKNICDNHVGSSMKALTGQSPDPVVFLNLMRHCWMDHCEQMILIRSIFLYLDRTFVIQTQGLPSIWDMGLNLFREHLESLPELEHKSVDGLLKLIEQERRGNVVDRGLMKQVLSCFSPLGMYGSSFEQPFLEATGEFYAAEGHELIQVAEVSVYVKHCQRRLEEEKERCSHYLEEGTRRPLIELVEKQLLSNHVSEMLEKGFASLMDNSKWEDLRSLYSLLFRVFAHDALRETLGKYIRDKGRSLVEDVAKEGVMVEELLAFKAKMDLALEKSFFSHTSYAQCIKESFHALVNLKQNRPAELIAKFMDQKLRAGNKGTSEEELEALMERVLVLFRFIQGKDIFEAFYKKDLAKRLLLGKSASNDAEKLVISKLKTECGSQFTNKLEGMFKDIELSRDINESFRESLSVKETATSTAGDQSPNPNSTPNQPSLEMSVHVLTTGFWPTYRIVDLTLPSELAHYQDLFKNFYLGKHSGRRLQWLNSLGQCVVKAHFPKGNKELQVSLFQTVALMLFNDSSKLSLSDLKEGTGIEDKELRKTLQSLACGKVRVLNKIPKGREVEDNDEFVFNEDFTNSLFRVKVNAIQMKETVEENTQTTERVFQDRQYQVDAAIVRIMKTRKVLSHTLLLTELFQQLQFPVKPADLKKRIESLIDREYLERDSSNPQIYNYLA